MHKGGTVQHACCNIVCSVGWSKNPMCEIWCADSCGTKSAQKCSRPHVWERAACVRRLSVKRTQSPCPRHNRPRARSNLLRPQICMRADRSSRKFERRRFDWRRTERWRSVRGCWVKITIKNAFRAGTCGLHRTEAVWKGGL